MIIINIVVIVIITRVILSQSNSFTNNRVTLYRFSISLVEDLVVDISRRRFVHLVIVNTQHCYTLCFVIGIGSTSHFTAISSNRQL